jgi:hypothetical protein
LSSKSKVAPKYMLRTPKKMTTKLFGLFLLAVVVVACLGSELPDCLSTTISKLEGHSRLITLNWREARSLYLSSVDGPPSDQGFTAWLKSGEAGPRLSRGSRLGLLSMDRDFNAAEACFDAEPTADRSRGVVTGVALAGHREKADSDLEEGYGRFKEAFPWSSIERKEWAKSWDGAGVSALSGYLMELEMKVLAHDTWAELREGAAEEDARSMLAGRDNQEDCSFTDSAECASKCNDLCVPIMALETTKYCCTKIPIERPEL